MKHVAQHHPRTAPRAVSVIFFADSHIGRSRVGKTYLVRQFFAGQFAFYATGVAGGNMRMQLKGFNATIERHGGRGDARDWLEAFERLREFLESGKAIRDAACGKLVDPFTLFRLRFVEGNDDERWWSANRFGAQIRSWSGRAFELVCLLHVPQMLRALGVWGVSVNARSWRSKSASPGAQIDLVLGRADGVANLCEMKWVSSGKEYAIDKAGSQSLLRKAEVFARETGTAKALHITMVSPGGVKRNAYSGVASASMTADDLFSPCEGRLKSPRITFRRALQARCHMPCG